MFVKERLKPSRKTYRLRVQVSYYLCSLSGFGLYRLDLGREKGPLGHLRPDVLGPVSEPGRAAGVGTPTSRSALLLPSSTRDVPVTSD